MKITQVKVRLFDMPMEKPFHPTWQPLPHTSSRIHVVEVHTDEGSWVSARAACQIAGRLRGCS
jgi:hypothetical protein